MHREESNEVEADERVQTWVLSFLCKVAQSILLCSQVTHQPSVVLAQWSVSQLFIRVTCGDHIKNTNSHP